MDERLLRFFIAVYEEKNLSRAAEKCYVSQPNISGGIKQLEERIGKSLFTRHKRGVILKEEAHYLYPIAKRIISEMNSIPEMFKEGEYKQKVVVGIADSISTSYKVEFFQKISTLLPHVQWDIRPMGRDCDLNILVREWKFEEHLFTPIWKENYVLCIPEHFDLAKKEVIELTDLHGVPFVHCPPCEAHQQCLSILNNAGEKWKTIANAASKTEVLTLLQAGLGVSFLPEQLIDGATGIKKIPYNGPKYFREIGLSYSKEVLDIVEVRKIVDLFSQG